MALELEIICPSCANLGETSGKFKSKKCFYSPEKDCWHCYHCQAKGRGNPLEKSQPQLTLLTAANGANYFLFTEELLKAYQEELYESERALDYCIQRLLKGFKQFGLGYDSGRDRIVIPVRDESERLVGVKFRAIQDSVEPKYIAETGSQAGFYFLKGEDATKVLVLEGEFDAMSARLLGFSGHIVATQRNGANESQIKRLKALGCKDIYLHSDADDAGLVLRADLFRSFEDNLREIILPDVKDVNELMSNPNAKEIFGLAVASAKTLLEQKSYSVFDRIEQTEEYLKNPVNTTGWSTGFPLFDDWLGGGLLPYTLTGLSAPGKTGKTSLINQLCFNLAVKGVKVGSLSLEMSPITYSIPSLLSIGLQKNIRAMPKDKLTEVIEQAKEDLGFMKNIVFYDGYGVTPSDVIDKWIRGQYEKNGVCVFFLDHVGYSLKDIKDAGEHSALSKTLRSITRQLPVHIIAVVQPKQLQFGQKSVTKHDLYGSVTWSQDLNALMTLEKLDKGTKLRLTDSHYPLAKTNEDGLILFYDHDTCTLRN